MFGSVITLPNTDQIHDKSKVHYCVPESLPVGMVLSRLNPIHSLPCYSLNIQFSIFFTFMPSSSELFISSRLSHPHSVRVCLPAFVLHVLAIKSSSVSAMSIINDTPYNVVFSLFLSLPPAHLPVFTLSTSSGIRLASTLSLVWGTIFYNHTKG